MQEQQRRTFSGDVQCRFLDSQGDHRNVELLEWLGYLDSNGQLWPAWQGLISDGATIPRECWTLIGGPFEGPYRRSAVVHDAAYEANGTLTLPDGSVFTYTRAQADAMLREAMLADGAPIALADVIYEAVHQFGEHAWAEDGRNKENKS